MKAELETTLQAIVELREEIRVGRENCDPHAEVLERQDMPTLQDKARKCEEYLGSSKGFGGRTRSIGSSDADRSRQRVQKAIAAAIDAMRKRAADGLKPLAKHLEDAIPAAIDGAFVYRPPSPVLWRFR